MIDPLTDQFVVEWQFPADPVGLRTAEPTLVLTIDASDRAHEGAATPVLV